MSPVPGWWYLRYPGVVWIGGIYIPLKYLGW